MANEFKVKNGLVVSGSADIEQDLRVRGTLTVDELHASITTSSIIYESGSTKFGDDLADTHDFTGSVSITGSISLNGEPIGTGKLNETTFESFTASYTTGSFTGSFIGDGSGLTNVPASGVIGLNLSQIATGSITASVSPDGFNVNTSTSITGSLNVSGEILSQTTPLVSSSSQIQITGTTGYSTFSSSIATTNFNQEMQLNSLETSTSSLNNFSASALSRLTNIETATSSLNSFTSSINTTIKNKLNSDGVISGSVQIDITQTTNYTSFSSSIATTDLDQTNRLNSIETSTGSLNSHTSSTNTRLGIIEGTTASLNTHTSSTNARLNSLETASGSIRTDFNTFTSSYNVVSSSLDSRLDVLEAYSGSQQVPTASYSFRTSQTDVYCKNMTGTQIDKGKVVRVIDALGDNPLIALADYTSEQNSANSLGITIEDIPHDSFGSVITQGILTGVNTSGMTAGALLFLGASGSFTTTPPVAPNHGVRLGEVLRVQQNQGSILVNIDNGMELSEAHDVTYTNITSGDLLVRNGNGVWVNTKSLNGSYSLTGSLTVSGSQNIIGTQTVSGSLIVLENLQVFGSSSITYVTASQLALSTSFISVNVFEPAERFGGIKVYDSGSLSHQATASLAWDSQNNRWVYQNASGSSYSGGMLISGPRNSGSLGDEPSLTSGKIPKSVGGDHIDNSIMNETAGVIYITGSLSATGTVYGTNITAIESTTSSLNSYTSSNDSTNTTQNNRLTSIETSTSSLNSFTNSINTTIKTKMNTDGVLSGSAQVVAALPSGTVSGSSQVLNGTTIHSGAFFNGISVVSGSGQISFNGITDKPTLVSGSSQITYSGISGIPSGIVSGSSQISFGSISGVPSGLVSGSSQISFGSISGVPSGLVSGSSQITLSSTTGFSTYLNQAVLTTSTPTFSTVTATTFIGALSGNASTASSISLSSGTAINHTGTGTVYIAKWTGGSTPVPFSISASGSTISNDATYGTLLIDRSNINANGAGANFHFTVLGTEYGGMGVTAETGVSSGATVGKMHWYLTTGTGTSRQERLTLDVSGNLTVNAGNSAGAFYLSDTATGLYRDNTYDVVLLQNASSGNALYLAGAGDVIVSLDCNNNDSAKKFIVGNNAVKATNELFSVNESGTVYVGGYLTVNGAGTSSSIYMSDSDEGNREIHCNSNRIGFLTQAGSWGSWCHDDGYWQSDMSVRAPIFYDSQDTNYYVDPNGTSNIYTLTVNNQVNHNTSSSRAKYHVYGSDGLYVIGMQSSITYGGLNDWGMTFQFNDESDRGFWWGDNGHSTAQGAMALTTNGNLTVARRIRVGYGESDTSDPTVPLQVYGSGGTVLDIQGSAGQLFSVTDDLTGDIFSISDISGVPMINVNTTNGTSFGSTIFPSANNAYDLGTSSFRWANVYTNDLHLSNEGKTGGNDIDGTTGNWTIQEGAEQLYIINNKNGKKYKINLTEVE